MRPTAEIHVRIEGENFVATTPHITELKGVSVQEHEAVNRLLMEIRRFCQTYIESDRPVPWKSDMAEVTSKDVHVRQLTGVVPAKIAPPVTGRRHVVTQTRNKGVTSHG